METKLEKLSKSRVKLNIKVPKEKMVDFFADAYKRLAPTIEIKGFRPGGAPKAMILEAIGLGKYHQQALDLALPWSYSEAIKNEKINPIQPPAIAMKQIGEDQDLIYEAEVDIIPEINLGNYQKIRVKYKPTKYTASLEEVEKVVKKLIYQAATFEEVNRPVQKDDRAEIDFEGTVDKVKQENLCSKNYPLIVGSDILIPGFEEKILAMKKGEEKEFDLNVPHVKDKDKTKKVRFKVKLNKVDKVILPKLDEIFAKKFGHKNMEDLKKAIAKSIVLEKDMQAKRKLEDEVLTKLIAGMKIDLPESLVEQEISRRISQIQAQTGPSLDKILEKMEKTLPDLRQDLRSESEKTIKIGLALGEVAKQEGLVPFGAAKDENAQREITRKTIDKLIEIATK